MTENFHLFLNVIVYFLNFAVIICMMFIITANFHYYEMAHQLFANWNKSPINQIIIIDEDPAQENPCPVGSELLLSYRWPGTKTGCNCIGIVGIAGYSNFEDKIISGSCSPAALQMGCVSISEVPERKMQSIWGKSFCGKRANQFSYLNNYDENIFESKCEEGKRSCGEVDSVHNILCVNKNESCPLETFISGEANQTALIGDSPELQDLQEKFSFYRKAYVEFKLSQGKVCIHNDEINMLLNTTYDLLNQGRYIKCGTSLSEIFKYDHRYIPLITTRTEYLFENDRNIYMMIKSLPNFPFEYFTNPLTIYGRSYIGWNKKCRLLLHKMKLVQNVGHFVQNFTLFYLIYSLIVLLYCMLFVMILKELIYENYALKILIISIHIVLILIIFCLIIWDYSSINSSIDVLHIIIKRRCSDEETNHLMVYLLETLEEVSRLFLLSIILYVVMIGLSILKILLTLYKMHKRRWLTRMAQGNRINELEMIMLV